VSRVQGLRRRLASQEGYTLTELLVTMVILGIVLGGITQLFSAGLRAESDVAFRHQAQGEARNALSYLRQEAHCAASATTSTLGTAPDQTQTLTLTPAAGCPRPSGETSGSPIQWCTIRIASYHYQLFRGPGAACNATGKRYADYLTTGVVFTYTTPSTALGYLSVDFPVDPNSQTTSPNIYRLKDDIVLRNTVRS
jgi:prepilin-type N-terminal cleavage/methylation domain-containing protein